jgi:signal transduction histidine kinase
LLRVAEAVTGTEAVLQVEPAAVGYWGVFTLAGLACLAGVFRARQVDNPAVRRGLVWLLGTTAVWALLKSVFLVAPTSTGQLLYTVGLVVGFATVWAWLYFCSAYTGREYHTNPVLRKLGLGVFLAVAVVKVTNPLHGLYFETTRVSTPFTHLAVEHQLFHWTVTGLSYALAGIGLFMLFELFVASGYDTRPLGVLTVLLGVPVAVDIVSVTTPLLLDLIYAPVGVALFALGSLFLFERRFLAVQETGTRDDPVVFLDSQGRIQEYTPAARRVFPALEGAFGERFETVLPEVGDVSETERIVGHDVDGEQRYFLTTSSRLHLGDADGRMVVFSDVTTAEQRRRELARHNQQLDEFANALTHELRNVLQIINSRLALASSEMSGDTVEGESVERASEMTDRMSGLVNDFRALARYGQTVDSPQRVAFEESVREAWTQTDTGEMDLVVGGEGAVEAGPGRLRQLLVSAFEFARHNGANTVRVELHADGFSIEDDGAPPGEDTSGYFTFGEAVPDAESGLKLPNVRAFARVHRWSVRIDTDYTEGTRLVVSDVTVY